MNQNITYIIGERLYVNLTNECSNDCEFCVRNGATGFDELNLWLKSNPTADEIIASIKENIGQMNEVVFCGFGEPTYCMDNIVAVSKFLRSINKKVRLNTNGHALLIDGESAVEKMVGLIDTISISLNATTAGKYDKICHSIYGLNGFDSMIEFTKQCVGKFPRVVLSVVDVIGADEVKSAQQIADSIGVELKVRPFIPPINN